MSLHNSPTPPFARSRMPQERFCFPEREGGPGGPGLRPSSSDHRISAPENPGGRLLSKGAKASPEGPAKRSRMAQEAFSVADR